MSNWLNHVVIAAPANGTTSHVCDPSNATGGGTVVGGTAFTPSAGRLLVVNAYGSVTFTTPSGWTLPTNGAQVSNGGLYVFWRNAAGSDTFTTTQNGSNYAVVFDVYEYPAGSTFISAVGATGINNGASGPNYTGLTGTLDVVSTVGASISGTAGGSTTWTAGTKTADTQAGTGANTGYGYSATEHVDFTGSTVIDVDTMTGSGMPPNYEKITYGIRVAPSGGGGGGPANQGLQPPMAQQGVGILGFLSVIEPMRSWTGLWEVASGLTPDATVTATLAVARAAPFQAVGAAQSANVTPPLAVARAQTFQATAAVGYDYTLFGSTPGPSSWAVDNNNVNLGVEFYVTGTGNTATAVRFWIPDVGYVGTITGEIFDANTSALLGTATFTISGTGWQTATFATPIPLSAGVEYRAVVTTVFSSTNTAYGATSGYWTTGGAGAAGITNGPLNAPNNSAALSGQDTFAYGSTAANPTTSFGQTNYWVDVTVTAPGGSAVNGTATPNLAVARASAFSALAAAAASVTATPGQAVARATAFATTTTAGASTTPGLATARASAFVALVAGAQNPTVTPRQAVARATTFPAAGAAAQSATVAPSLAVARASAFATTQTGGASTAPGLATARARGSVPLATGVQTGTVTPSLATARAYSAPAGASGAGTAIVAPNTAVARATSFAVVATGVQSPTVAPSLATARARGSVPTASGTTSGTAVVSLAVSRAAAWPASATGTQSPTVTPSLAVARAQAPTPAASATGTGAVNAGLAVARARAFAPTVTGGATGNAGLAVARAATHRPTALGGATVQARPATARAACFTPTVHGGSQSDGVPVDNPTLRLTPAPGSLALTTVTGTTRLTNPAATLGVTTAPGTLTLKVTPGALELEG